eukprot:m.289598 g.289598  ORF g.289598 m.289598 type:complete len:229 (+) comp16373_c0_seq85:596-1282(+)
MSNNVLAGQPNSSGECSCFMQNEASDKASDKNVRFSFDWLGPKCQYFREGPKRIFSLIFFAFLLSIMPCVIRVNRDGHEVYLVHRKNFLVFVILLLSFLCNLELSLNLKPAIEYDDQVWYSQFYWRYTIITGHDTRQIYANFLITNIVGYCLRWYIIVCTHQTPTPGPKVEIFRIVIYLCLVEVVSVKGTPNASVKGDGLIAFNTIRCQFLTKADLPSSLTLFSKDSP